MEIKRLTRFDGNVLDQITSIHISVLKESFLNNFGKSFLNIIYKNLLTSPETILLTGIEDNKILCFSLAMTDYSKFSSTALSSQKTNLVWQIIKSVTAQPFLVFPLLLSLPGLLFSKNTPHSELQFIAVLPEYQSKGIGKQLMQELEKEFQKSGVTQYFVGTKSENTLSNKFYQGLGFTLDHTSSYFGDSLNYYISPRL